MRAVSFLFLSIFSDDRLVGRGSDNLAGIMPGKLPTTSVRNMSVIFFLRTSRAGKSQKKLQHRNSLGQVFV